MDLQASSVDVSSALLDMLRNFPSQREVEHCGTRFAVSPFDFYVHCPTCGAQLKLRGMSASPEVEDIFDAVFGWMNQPNVGHFVKRRQQELAQDGD